MHNVISTIFIVLCLCRSAFASDTNSIWIPEKTWVFVVGILNWQDPETYQSYSDKNRRDAELVEYFESKGIPKNHTIYLQDKNGTTDKIQKEFETLLSEAGKDDLLFLYYCGHGYLDTTGSAYFVSYDTGTNNPGWPVASIINAVEKYFKGSRAFLTADCCYSGALSTEARRQKYRVSYACLSSSTDDATSTENWTFTESLLDSFRGMPQVDTDKNKVITFEEMAIYTIEEMAVVDEQTASFITTGSFKLNTPIVSVQVQPQPRIGERVEALRNGGEYETARIIDKKDSRYLIRFIGKLGADDVWMEGKDIRSIPVIPYPIGAKVQVEWKDKWYPAVVLSNRGSVHYIKYDGYDDSWNEWVSPKRIRK